jgi:prepilin-type N-terminal cleavage/methylation domain-containing protein
MQVSARPPRRGFTLIELLIVLSIILLLGGMVMSVMSTARKYGQRTSTQVTMHKVDNALRMFQRDIGVLPYQASYPATVTPANPFPNNLYQRLDQPLSAAATTAFNNAVATAAGKYSYFADLNQSWNNNYEGNLPGNIFTTNLTYRYAYLLPSSQVNGERNNADPVQGRRYCALFNRVAAERARLCVYAGALSIPGPYIVGPTMTAPLIDLTGTPLLSTAEQGGITTGWCNDYFEGSLTAREWNGAAIVDAWGRPLIYVCQVVPRSRSTSALILGSGIKSQDFSWYGMGATGFAANTGPWAGLVAANRWRLLQNGRVTVGADCVDDAPAPVDATYNPGSAMASDRRYYSGPGYEIDYELWSAGPDGCFDWTRSATTNNDNIGLFDYDRGLQ